MENTMSNTKHTPTPWWIAQSAGPGILAIDATDPQDGQLFAVCEIFGINDMRENSPVAEANAAFIVKACNSHDQLIAELQNGRVAIDVLMAQLIEVDPSFKPTESAAWPRLVAIKDALEAVEAA
jgi:hypothetical protein